MIHGYEHQSSDDKLFRFLLDQCMAKNKLSEEAVDTYIDRVVAGMGLQIGNTASIPVEKRHFVHSDSVKKPYAPLSDVDPIADLQMRDSDVKRRTGFRSKEALLCYVFVVCDGDLFVFIDMVRRMVHAFRTSME